MTGELADKVIENRLGTVPLTQKMKGELSNENGFGTAPLTHNVSQESEECVCEQMSDMGNGFGIGGILTTRLAKEPNNANQDIECQELNVDNLGTKQAPTMSPTKVHKVAKLGLGLATEVRLGLNRNNVIMKSMSGVKSSTGSPRATT